MRRFLLAVTAFIVYGSLYPFDFHFARAAGNPLLFLLRAWPTEFDRFLLRDSAVNLLLYLPFGFAAFLALAQRTPRVVAAAVSIGAGLGLSTTLEMLQIYDAQRTCSMADVLCNTIGAAAGVFGALLALPHWSRRGSARIPRPDAGGALLLACAWACYELYPAIPQLSRTRLIAGFHRTLTAGVSPVELCASTAEWFVFALLLRAAGMRMRAPYLALALLVMPLRLLLIDRGLLPAELLGGVLALLLWMLPGESWRGLLGPGLLAFAIGLRELQPFHFTATAHHFSWIPFSATFGAQRQEATLVLLRKAFQYGSLLWLWRAEGFRYRTAATALALGLFLLEWLERNLPGREAEITDATLAILLAAILWSLESRRRTSRYPPAE